MSPANIAAARLLPVVDDSAAPGTITNYLQRHERVWRKADNDTERARTSRVNQAQAQEEK